MATLTCRFCLAKSDLRGAARCGKCSSRVCSSCGMCQAVHGIPAAEPPPDQPVALGAAHARRVSGSGLPTPMAREPASRGGQAAAIVVPCGVIVGLVALWVAAAVLDWATPLGSFLAPVGAAFDPAARLLSGIDRDLLALLMATGLAGLAYLSSDLPRRGLSVSVHNRAMRTNPRFDGALAVWLITIVPCRVLLETLRLGAG